VSKVLANDDGRAEVEALLSTSKDSVTQMLDDHRNVVEALRDALLEREELIGDDILEVIRCSQGAEPGDGAGHESGVGRLGRIPLGLSSSTQND